MELRVNVAEPISMKLTDFFPDSLARTKGQVRTTTLKETAKLMNDFIACVGDIDVQEVRYEHGERFIQYCLDSGLSAGTATKKIKHLKRVFQLAEDRGQLDRHPLRKLKRPKVGKRKVRVFTDQAGNPFHPNNPRFHNRIVRSGQVKGKRDFAFVSRSGRGSMGRELDGTDVPA